MENCPCCGLRTIPTRGDYDICSYCGWEDEPIAEGQYSDANGATIRQYVVAQLGVAHARNRQDCGDLFHRNLRKIKKSESTNSESTNNG